MDIVFVECLSTGEQCLLCALGAVGVEGVSKPIVGCSKGGRVSVVGGGWCWGVHDGAS